MGYNGYGIYSSNEARMYDLINKVAVGYEDVLFDFYGVIILKEDYYNQSEGKVFNNGTMIVYCGGERLRTVETIFESTHISCSAQEYNLRNYFHWENDKYLFEFKSTYKLFENEKLIYIPFEAITNLELFQNIDFNAI